MLRIGLGHDTHRLVPNRLLRLGGVLIPHSLGLLGHSDADVLLHAIADALLGAAGLGDLGEHFSDRDPANLDRDSADILSRVHHMVQERGFEILNLDTILFAQEPKLSPYKEAIRQQVAKILHISPDQIGVKAKTGEQIGIIGRQEAISAEAVVLLER